MQTAEQSQARPQSISERTRTRLLDRTWRLDHLYHVEDKVGRIVRFRLNDQQRDFYQRSWYLNVILKARQLGFSTFIAIFFLDTCIFVRNTRAGIVDARIDDAKKKLAKIKLAYDMMPDELKAKVPLVSASAYKLEWANGSSVEVGTSHRGGTLQMLHISELGKIAAKFPDKAKEIRTGALNTIQAGQFVFIESTAEGQEGDFFETCQAAEAKARMNAPLSVMDFKFHFCPWWRAKEYVLDFDMPLPDDLERYFERLRADRNIILTRQQKSWYAAKAATQRDEMKREYPSTPAEAFEASVEGAILGPEMELAEREGRVGAYPAHAGVPVHMFFDIGRKDYTAIWFAQIFAGKVRCVGYFQDMLAGLPHYTEYCFGTEHAKKVHPGFVSRSGMDAVEGVFKRKGWVCGHAVFPHDIAVEEWGSQRTRIEQALTAGFKAKLATTMSLHDGINASRATLLLTEFDAAGCGTAAEKSKRKGSGSNNGVAVLKAYRWKWDDKGGRWVTGTEDHDANSHGAHSFRYLSTSWRELPAVLEPKPKPAAGPLYAVADSAGVIKSAQTFDQILRQKRLAAKNMG